MPTSRWEMTLCCRSWMYSTGSSIVTMWPGAFVLRWWTIAATVVDFPAPVAPTTRIRPCRSSTSEPSRAGRSSSSKLGTSVFTRRSTTPDAPRAR